MTDKDKGPFHIVNSLNGKHIGPFTTELDALFARSIGSTGWDDGRVMNHKQFKVWVEAKA